MMIRLTAVIAFALVAQVPGVWSDEAKPEEPKPDPSAVLARVVANRPSKDLSLKARLIVGRAEPVPVEILVKNTAAETRTIYRAAKLELLVVQPVEGAPRFFRRGVGELTGAGRSGTLLGSGFSFYDLAAPFLRWPSPKFVGWDRVRGRDCIVIEAKEEGEPYAAVKMWIDKEYMALLRAEAFDADGGLRKRFIIGSFRRVGEVMVPKGIEIGVLPPGQVLPAEEKSRLDVFDGVYDGQLPTERFAAENFGTNGVSGTRSP